MENQTVEVICQIDQREFGLRTGNADGADEQAIAVFLMREDMLDAGADLALIDHRVSAYWNASIVALQSWKVLICLITCRIHTI